MTITKQKVDGKEIAVMEGSGGRIGVVLLFAVGSCEVPIGEITGWVLNQKELTLEDMPNPPSRYDAFQCTCSQENSSIWNALSEKKLVALENLPGERLNTSYITLPSKRSKDEYILERRVWTRDGEVVAPSHPNVARLQYLGGDDAGVAVVMFDDFKDWELQQAIEEIFTREFIRQQSIVNGTRHRQALYRLIERNNGVHFLGGMSTWFVPLAGVKQVEAFQDYLNTVAAKYKTTSYPTEMRVIDAIDNTKMRNDIASDVAREVQNRYEKLLDDTQSYLEKMANKENVNPDKMERALASRLAQVEKMQGLRAEYEKMLNMKINIEKKPLDSVVQVDGRAKAILLSIQEALR
ncbi:MAG: hypothetical protein M0R06_23035 [Sphaerochaeta sp.]|jgi:hypothetical protein|nr:hypothetical protein [Sphaerochaeta sp.]